MECDDAVKGLSASLRNAGLQVTPSFDLQSARQSLKNPHACTCPSHGSAQCTCQYVILLVRGQASNPITLIAHGHGSRTFLSLDQLIPSDSYNELGEIIRSVIGGLIPAG
jgi:hypothetical protein